MSEFPTALYTAEEIESSRRIPFVKKLDKKLLKMGTAIENTDIDNLTYKCESGFAKGEFMIDNDILRKSIFMFCYNINSNTIEHISLKPKSSEAGVKPLAIVKNPAKKSAR